MATFGAAVQRVALRAADSWPLYVTRQVDVAFRPLHFRRVRCVACRYDFKILDNPKQATTALQVMVAGALTHHQP